MLSTIRNALAQKSTQPKKLVEAFPANNLSAIPMADRLPLEVGCVVRDIGIPEFERQENIIYTESALIEEKLLYHVWSKLGDIKNDEVVHKHLYNRKPVVLAPMENSGKGLFLKTTAEPIQIGDIVWASYGGEVMTESWGLSTDYSFAEIHSDREMASETIEKSRLKNIDAKRYRGLGAYMQYAPTVVQLQNYNVDAQIKDYIFPANTAQYACLVGNITVILFFAIRTIQPGEPIYYCYSANYPEQHPDITFNVTNRIGQVIGKIHHGSIQALPDIQDRLTDKIDHSLTQFVHLDLDDVPDFREYLTKTIAHFLEQEMVRFPVFSVEHQIANACYHQLQDTNLFGQKIKNLEAILESILKIYRAFGHDQIKLKKSFGPHLDIDWLAYFINRQNFYNAGIKIYAHDPRFKKHLNPNPDLRVEQKAFPFEQSGGYQFCQQIIDLLQQELKQEKPYHERIESFLQQNIVSPPKSTNSFYERINRLNLSLRKEFSHDSKSLRNALTSASKCYNAIQCCIANTAYAKAHQQYEAQDLAALFTSISSSACPKHV